MQLSIIIFTENDSVSYNPRNNALVTLTLISYLDIFNSSSMSNFTLFRFMMSWGSVPFTQVYTTSIGTGKHSLNQINAKYIHVHTIDTERIWGSTYSKQLTLLVNERSSFQLTVTMAPVIVFYYLFHLTFFQQIYIYILNFVWTLKVGSCPNNDKSVQYFFLSFSV